jgi:8-oxo-dGTP diphosphatase
MIRSSKVVSVVAGIIVRDNQVLIGRRKAGKSQAGRWEFPGGKLEIGESPEECLQRELMEELGISVSIHGHFITTQHQYPETTIELMVFFCTTQSEPKHFETHDCYAWVSTSDLRNYDWAPADLPAVQNLILGGLYRFERAEIQYKNTFRLLPLLF